MANRIEILIEVDPTGRGAAGIRKVTADIEGVERRSRAAGSAGRDALGGIAGGLGIPTSLAAATGAIAAGIAAIGVKAVQSANEGQDSLRILRAEAKESAVNFAEADEKARLFAEGLAITESQGERSYGQLLRLNKAAGDLGIDRVSKGLTDLSAAYGLSAEEIKNLTNQLLSGQDEALNRLGIADPSQLYKRYAKEVGTTVEALTDEEKVRARILAVVEKGERFEGAAQERLQSQAGQWATVAANVANASRHLGEYLNKYTLLRDLPTALANPTDPFGALGRRDDAVREANRKRAQAEAERRYDTLAEYNELSHLQAELAKDPTRKFEDANFFLASFSLSNEQEGKIRENARKAGEAAREELRKLLEDEARDAENKAVAAIDPTLRGSGEEAQKIRAKVAANARARAEEGKEDKLRAAENLAGFDAERVGRLNALKAQAKEQTDYFIKQYTDLFKDKRIDVASAQFAERQFNNIKNILPPEEREKISKGLADLFSKFEKQGLTYLKRVRDEAESLFSTLAERYAGDEKNPFVKILVEAEEEGRRLERTFGVLGDAAVSELQGIQRAYQQQKIMALELDADLSATAKRREAEALYQQRPGELLGQERTRLEITEARVNAALKATQYEAKALNLTRFGAGNGGLDRREVNEVDVQFEQYKRLIAILKDVKGEAGELGRRSRGAVNEALIGLFEGLDPDLQDKIARSKVGSRDVFASAYRDRAAEQQKQVQDAIENARLFDEQIKKAEDDVARIKEFERAGLSTSEIDARILRRTDELGKENLSPELRRARFESLERDAERTQQQQKDATDAVKAAREATDRNTNALDNLAKAVTNTSDRRVLIEILNRAQADVREDLYGDLATQHIPGSKSR